MLQVKGIVEAYVVVFAVMWFEIKIAGGEEPV